VFRLANAAVPVSAAPAADPATKVRLETSVMDCLVIRGRVAGARS